ncbi:MAG TPA: hypothetical protein DHV92_05085 [Ruminococcaceae bacterium]|nr:hypothetical protein [Oscillospiraceae bacterium]
MAAAIMCLLMVVNLVGCVCVADSEPVSEEVIALENTIKKAELPANSVKANLYFDNTQSMYGYINAASNFAVACGDLIETVKGYANYSMNALVRKDNGFLGWGNVDISNFRSKDFYTFNKGSFNNAAGEYGPLGLLFKNANSPVNFDELNVFITDLAEQQLNNKELAQRINEVLTENDNRSAALYYINSNFSGLASVPVPSSVVSGQVRMTDENYTGTRPFYCLIVGPTSEVVNICNVLNDSLKGSGLQSGRDFDYLTVLSKRGLQYTPISKMDGDNAVLNVDAEPFDNVCAEGKRSDYDEYPSVTHENSNFNFNVELCKSDDDSMYYDADHMLPGLYYKYTTDSGRGSLEKSTYGIATMNFAIKLSDLANGEPANNTEYSIPKESLKVSGLKLEEYEVTDEYGDSYGTEEEFVWEDIPMKDLLESSEPYMDMPTCQLLENGKTLDRVRDFASNDTLREIEEYPKDALNLYTVNNKSGALIVRVNFKEMNKLSKMYSKLTISFKVMGKRPYEENTPGWIGNLNLADNVVPTAANGLYSKTVGLNDFYTYLVGKMSSKVERDKYEVKMSRVITDVVITVALDD